MRARDVLAVAAVAVFVAAVVLLPIRRPGFSAVSFDVYEYFYVHMLYALRVLEAGGTGLLWNPFQGCGVPFLANQFAGLFYPPNWLFPLFGLDAGMWAVTVVNLLIGAVGAYALARELALSRAAAMVGALGFALGNTTLVLSKWNPAVVGTYVWYPAALLCCERLLKTVTLGWVIALAVVLTLAFFPGFPQTLIFLYLLIALRVLWALLVGDCPQPRRSIAALVTALGLPLLLAAVQLFPAFELAYESVRNVPQAAYASLEGVHGSNFYKGLSQRRAVGVPFLPVTLCLAAAALATRRQRHVVAFYALAAALFLSLAFGPGSPPFELWTRLPLGQRFGGPSRFLWPLAFCLNVLATFGVDVIADAAARPGRLRGIPVALAASVALLLVVLMSAHLTGWELATLSPLLIAAAALRIPRLSALLGPAFVLAVGLSTTMAPFGWLLRWLPSGAPLTARAEFAALRARLSPQDRVMLVYPGQDFSFMRKTATVFQLPANFDYEAQMTYRYAAYFTMMRTGRPIATIGDVYYPSMDWFPNPSRRLLDLTAARYLVVDRQRDILPAAFPDPPLIPVALGEETPGLAPMRIYENTSALPRAFVVERVAVIPDPRELLVRLASGEDDPRRVAFVEAPPPSGFLGHDGTGAEADVTFETNAPEHLVLRVRAPQKGFLFLADQYYAGWEARVNGQLVPIQRANYAFRLIEVPIGESVVEFRFRPRIVLIGAMVSATTGLAMVVGLALTWRMRAR